MKNITKCDKCGLIDKNPDDFLATLSGNSLPKGWARTTCGDLCPRCHPIYEKYMAEARSKFQKLKV